MDSYSSENIIKETYLDNYSPLEMDEKLYNKIFDHIFDVENIEKSSHGWKRVRQAIEPKIERQHAFNNYDKEVDFTENIFRSLHLDLCSLNDKKNIDSKEENVISKIDMSGNMTQ